MRYVEDELLNRLTEIGEIVSEALERTPEERDSFLAEACKTDRWLRKVVEDAVQGHATPEWLLKPESAHRSPLWHEITIKHSGTDDVGEGVRIGPYRIIREIARGGMGVVLLAERADGQYEQRVALKILAHGANSFELFERFAQERQILASLDHPAIARLLDSGVTVDGRPYFVMEHVRGVPIDQYCDEQRLTIAERLKLFRVVVDAVQFAHRSLVVHRDLKPGNILVTADGRVKLLDFGIAKVLDSASVPNSAPPTRAVLRIMTPEYASPEQVTGQRITTSSDVYQLGLLLYELISGQRPHSIDKRSSSEIERCICEIEPVPPSVAATKQRFAATSMTKQTAIDEISAARRTSAKRLRRTLQGDLDTIVLMALKKEPERRFESAEHLGRDIDRFLSSQPVSACRDSLSYRFRKFLRRRTAAVLVAICGLTVVFGFTWRLAIERDTARSEAASATEVSSFLKDVLEYSDPGQLKGESISVRELLAWGAQHAATGLDARPGTRATVLATLGEICRKRGMYDHALPLLEEALALREEHVSPRDPAVPASLNALADLHMAQSKYNTAEALYRRALSIQEEALGRHDPQVAATLDRIGRLMTKRARFPDAAVLFNDALKIREESLGPWHPDVAESLTNLATLNSEHGRYREAEQQLERALTITRESLGFDHPRVATIITRFAYLCRSQGRFGDAERHLRHALGIREQRFGPEHPQVLASLNNLGDHLHKQGQLEQAEAYYRRALETAHTCLPREHSTTATVLNNLCALHLDRGQYVEAEELCAHALHIRQSILRADHPMLASSLLNLARLHQNQQHYVEAEALYLQASKIIESSSRIDARAARLSDTGHIWLKLEKYEEATSAFRQCLGLLDGATAAGNIPGHKISMIRASAFLGLGDSEGDPEKARAMWTRAINAVEELPCRDDSIHAVEIRARALLRLGRTRKAQPLIDRLRSLGWHNPEVLDLASSQGLAAVPENPPA